MSPSLRRLRGTVGTGLTWAAGWAVAGLGIGVTSLITPFLPWDGFFSVFDAPLPALAIPGFVSGVLFSLLVRAAASRRRLDELSLGEFTRWGAAAGVLLSLVPDTMVLLGLATRADGALGPGMLTAMLLPPLVAASAASAAATLLLARRAHRLEYEAALGRALAATGTTRRDQRYGNATAVFDDQSGI
jgi:hypothetical protein